MEENENNGKLRIKDIFKCFIEYLYGLYMHRHIHICVCVCVCVCARVLGCFNPNSLQLYGLWPIRLHCPWDSPGKNTGVGCHFLLQGFSQLRDRTYVSYVFSTGRLILYH